MPGQAGPEYVAGVAGQLGGGARAAHCNAYFYTIDTKKNYSLCILLHRLLVRFFAFSFLTIFDLVLEFENQSEAIEIYDK